MRAFAKWKQAANSSGVDPVSVFRSIAKNTIWPMLCSSLANGHNNPRLQCRQKVCTSLAMKSAPVICRVLLGLELPLLFPIAAAAHHRI